jgi:hypothetical protein
MEWDRVMVLDNSLVELSKFMLTSQDKKIEKTSTSSPLKTANQGRYVCIFICIYIYIYIFLHMCTCRCTDIKNYDHLSV